mgnify:CR=1 FL=1
MQCLATYDWRLDLATDHYFTNPERFNPGGGSSGFGRPSIDKSKLEHLFSRYKGMRFKADFCEVFPMSNPVRTCYSRGVMMYCVIKFKKMLYSNLEV